MQHESVQAELREKQEDMDQLISIVEDLQRELAKVPNSDMSSILNEMEALRDQWLLVSCGLKPKAVLCPFFYKIVIINAETTGFYI